MKNRIVYILLFWIFLGFDTFAQANKGIGSISLNGTWGIIFDDKNEGVEGEWHLDKNYDLQRDKREIEAPSCWEEFEKNYEGAAFYRKKFTMPKEWDGKILELKFDASNYLTQVWLNEQVVGFHEGGYTPFSFRIDKLARAGEINTLTVRVVSPIILTDKRMDGLGRQEVPMWRGAITGGIWQPVTIFASGSERFTDVFIEPNIHTNSATFNLEIENTKTNVAASEINIKILSNTGEAVAVQSKQVELQPGINRFEETLEIPRAEYWSVDHPYLYKVEMAAFTNGQQSDKWSAKFGMREFTARDNQFVLNGKPLYLKACFFEGLYPVKLAYPDSREMAIKEITLAKEAGFNMIRPWRKPAPPMWLDLCDSLGILTVGSMVTECMHRPVSTPRLPFVVENEIRKTILSNRNRTCIVQWELFNEINRPILAQMLNSMSLVARDLDPTRMILDESGGWGEGANVYLPYERTPIKFNDIHHYSGSQVHEKEYNGYLAVAKTEEEIKEFGLGNAKGYGKNVVPGMMSYISELGYGSLPDLTANNALFQSKGNPIVAPTIYHKKMADELAHAMKKTGFDKIYPNIGDFYLEQQKMHGIANKRMIEAARSNSDIAGYCVHALVAGDWVMGAGLLDLWRNPKSLVYDMTKAASGEQIVAIRILPRNVYAEKGARLEITGISELKTEEAANIAIEIKSARGKTVYKKILNKDFKYGVSQLFADELNTKDLKGNYAVEVKVNDKNGKRIAFNSQPFDVFTEERLTIPAQKFAVADPDNSLIPFFQKRRLNFVEFSSNLPKGIPVVVGKANRKNPDFMRLANELRKFAEEGGYVVFLDVPGEKTPASNRVLREVESDALPFGAQLLSPWETRSGWSGKSHIVTEHPVFKGLPTNIIMHGVYENIHPKTTMVKQQGNYIAGAIGYDHFPNLDIMLRHYNGPGETWWAADVLEAEIGKGKLLLSTLDIIDHLGKDPAADKVLYNIIEFAQKQ